MKKLYPSGKRGHTKIDWLDSYHTFSFGEFHDPEAMGFKTLRVINDDRVAPNSGFGTHPHQNMEIVTYVLAGALEHRDSMGNGSIIQAGDFQYMSAGSGVTHSEFNPSKTDPVHLLQIWIRTNEVNAEPRYGQKNFPLAAKRNRWCALASPDGADGSLGIRQNASLFVTVLDSGEALTYRLGTNRHAFLHCVRGSFSVSETLVKMGDGLALSDQSSVDVTSLESNSELLLFDLA